MEGGETNKSGHTLRSGQWVRLNAQGYTVDATQFSNKGPLFVVMDSRGVEHRARLDLATGKWSVSSDGDVPAADPAKAIHLIA